MTARLTKAVTFTLHPDELDFTKQARHLYPLIVNKWNPLVEKAEVIVAAKPTKVESPYKVLGR